MMLIASFIGGMIIGAALLLGFAVMISKFDDF